jgi:multidrug efflux pump subunit AcrB
MDSCREESSLHKLTRFSVRNIIAVLILALLVFIGGIYMATRLKMEAMPDINFPVVVAVTPYPGASPEEIDQKVTQPVERAFQGIKGISKVNSISADSTSVVVVQFAFETDLDKAQQQMSDAIRRLRLPTPALEPTFNRFGFNTFPMMNLSIIGANKHPSELEHWADDVAKPSLESVNGVGEVQVKGEGPKAVYIRLLPEKLKQYHLSAQQVQQALASGNLSLPVGILNMNSIDIPVHIEQKITSIEQLKNYNIAVPVNPVAGFESSFAQMDKGFQGMGQAMGDLGQGLGQVGQGVGLLQAQIPLLQQAQQLQAQMIGLQLELNQEQGKPVPNEDTIRILQVRLNGAQQALTQIHTQIEALQAKIPKAATGRKALSGSGTDIRSMKLSSPSIPETEMKTVKLSDIASITESVQGNALITRTNGKPSIQIEVIKNPEANLIEVANAVNQKIGELKKENSDLDITLLFDQSKPVKASIHSMVREGTLGALFAALMIFLFLRNFRMTLISIVSIPLSILATLILLHQAGITLNVMTLGGMAVAIGRVVDDSIVVIENIYRHLRQNEERDVHLIEKATQEVAAAITSSTLTTVAVFIPLAFVSGIVGKLFLPFAVTVAFALLCSLLVAVTIVPVLAKIMLLRGKKFQLSPHKSRSAETYKKALAWALDHKGWVLSLSILLLFSSLSIIPWIGTSFIPADKDKVIQISLKAPPGTDVKKTDEMVRKIEAKVDKRKEVDIISTSIGNLRGGSPLTREMNSGSSNQASLFLVLHPSTEMDLFLSQVRAELEPLQTEGEITVSEVRSTGPPSSSMQVIIKGNNLEEMKLVTEQLTEKIKRIKGLTNVGNNLSARKEKILITVDPEKAAKQGLVAQQVAYSVRSLLQAEKVLELEKDGQTQEVRLGLEAKDLNRMEKLKEVEILTPTGKGIRLDELATLTQTTGPVTIQKENGQEVATVSASIAVKDTGAVSRQVQTIIHGMDLPKGIQVTLGGDTEEMNKSFTQLGFAMLVAIGAVYVVMLIAFGEAIAPFTILFSLPYAAIGGLIGLWLCGQPISVSSMIGALMLIGIVVTNAIVLIDRVIQMRRRGLEVRAALLEAAGTRLRPILMTALATIFALLPLGLGYGEGTLISQGLAIVVIGGLASSTLLTLFIVPIIYDILTRIQGRFGQP